MSRLAVTMSLGLAFIIGSLATMAQAQTQISLWEKGAPGFEARRDMAEQAKDYWVKSVNNPSLTLFAPDQSKNSGTAIIIVPGGGHALLVWPPEGLAPAKYLQSLGITAFALKYRLAREAGSPYSIEKDAALDLRRAIRYVRAHASQYGIKHIGIMGFSAGGELVSMVSFDDGLGDPKALDPIDRESSHPDFSIFIYPGPLGIPEKLSSAPPPVFMLNAYDDKMAVTDTDRLMALYEAWPKVPLERHILSGGAHGFNMGERSQLKAVKDWPHRLNDWLLDMDFIRAVP